jgi:hypothetical protein
VQLVRETGKPIAQVARDLGINEGTLGNWVNADKRRRGEGGGALSWPGCGGRTPSWRSCQSSVSLDGPVRADRRHGQSVDQACPHRLDARGEGRPKMRTCRQVIIATRPDDALAMVEGLGPEVRHALGSMRYGPYVVASLLTNENDPMPWDGIYAMVTPGAAFNMFFNTANLLRAQPGRSPAEPLSRAPHGLRIKRPRPPSAGQIG